MEPPKDVEVHELHSVYRWSDEEGNICFAYKKNYQPMKSIEDAGQEFEQLAQLLEGKKANFIFDIDNGKPSRKEIRDYASKQFLKFVNAFAFVGTKPMTRMLVNLFHAFKKPPYPAKIFSSAEKAREWLRKHPVR